MITDTASLLSAYRSGAPRAADELFRRHLATAREIARIRLGRNEVVRRCMDSQDVLQEALLRALPALQTVNITAEGQFLMWLARIVENTIRDAAKGARRQKRNVLREHPASSDLDELAARVGREPTPSAVLLGQETAELYLRALGELPSHYRDIIVLRKHAQYDFVGIARELGLASDAQARALLSRALAALAEQMASPAKTEDSNRPNGPSSDT